MFFEMSGRELLQNSSKNLSTFVNETESDTPSKILSILFLSSGTIVGFLAFVTVLGNGLLLLAIWKDPYKVFRIPPTVFVIGLAIADLLTGLLVSPVFSHSRIFSYIQRNKTSCVLDRTLLTSKVSRILSLMTMNASYMVLLLLTWSQFYAIRFPHKQRVFITTKRVTIWVIAVWIYAIFFALLSFALDAEILNKLDFYMHTMVFIVLLIVAYCCLYGAYKTQLSQIVAATTQRCSETQRRESNRLRRRCEKQFTTVTLVLVLFIIIFTLPSMVLQFLTVYYENDNCQNVAYQIARELSSDVLFLKFALDPFVYFWRLMTYRKALWSVIPCLETPVIGRNVFALSMRSGIPRKYT